MDIADAFIDSTNTSIVNSIECSSQHEEPWDGFGGLVRVGDSAVFKEEGLLTILAPHLSCLSHESQRPKSFMSKTPSPRSGSVRNTDETTKSSTNGRDMDMTLISTRTSSDLEMGHANKEDEAGSTFHKSEVTPPHSVDGGGRGSRGSDRKSVRSRVSNTRSIESTMDSSIKQQQHPSGPKSIDRVISGVEKFKSRLIAVRLEGLPARETMIKCAAIAEDAFTLALKKLKEGEFSDAYLLAEVAESACPSSVVSAKNKILKLKQSAQRRLSSAPFAVS